MACRWLGRIFDFFKGLGVKPEPIQISQNSDKGGGADVVKRIEKQNLQIVTEAYVLARIRSHAERLHPIYLIAYEALCNELEGTFWAPYSSYRSLEHQKALYDQGRTPSSIARGEKRVTNAPAGMSPHNWGCATDWAEWQPGYKGKDPWDKAEWTVFRDAVRKVGLIWGGDFKSPVDRPHAELPLRISWKKVGLIFQADGKEAAEAAILENSLL